MRRSITWYRKIKEVFPPHKPLARLVARLFVLWQDLLYEEAGIKDDEGFEGLDQFGHGAATRRFYFLRGNSRTLYSAKKLFEELGRDQTFAGWLKEDQALMRRYSEAVRIVRRNSKHVTAIRNSIGAHVEQDIGKAIQYLDPTDDTTLEIHREHFINPYPATDILFAALINQVVFSKERLAAFRAKVKPLAEATGAMIKAMSEVATVYIDQMNLLPDSEKARARG